MNSQRAYQLCHQAMLENPGYTAHESAEVTYILVQISDLGESIAIQGQLINPALPEASDLKEIVRMSTDMQVGILAFKNVTETVRQAHEALKGALKYTDDRKTFEKAKDRLVELFTAAAKRVQ